MRADGGKTPALQTTMSSPPNRSTAASSALSIAPSSVTSHLTPSEPSDVSASISGGDVEPDHGRALAPECLGCRPTDTRSRAGDQDDFACERRGRALALQLRLLELPVLDVEEVRLGQRDPAIQHLRPLDRVEGVQRDVACDQRVARRAARRENAELAVEYNPWRRVQHRERVREIADAFRAK